MVMVLRSIGMSMWPIDVVEVGCLASIRWPGISGESGGAGICDVEMGGVEIDGAEADGGGLSISSPATGLSGSFYYVVFFSMFSVGHPLVYAVKAWSWGDSGENKQHDGRGDPSVI